MSNIVLLATATATNADLDMIALRTDARQGEVVLRKVYDFLGRFVAYPSEDAHVAHALWCVHTHFMDVWETTPRIAFLSAEPASGKSRALEISELLVPNPVLTVNVSPSYIFRKVGGKEGGATILYDEIDTVFGPKAQGQRRNPRPPERRLSQGCDGRALCRQGQHHRDRRPARVCSGGLGGSRLAARHDPFPIYRYSDAQAAADRKG